MRLIDADEFKKQIAGMAIINNYPADKANDICELIDCQPTAYDVDKVVEQLEQKADDSRKYWQEFDDEDAFGEMNAYSNAIEIVKSVGVAND